MLTLFGLCYEQWSNS